MTEALTVVISGSFPLLESYLDLVGTEIVGCGARHAQCHGLTAADVSELEFVGALRVLGAPLEQADDDRDQVDTGRRQDVLVAGAHPSVSVGPARDQAGVGEGAQVRGRGGRRQDDLSSNGARSRMWFTAQAG